MADTTIDTVAIEFEGNVEDFSTSVDKLISFMNNLKKSTKEGTEQLSRLSSSVKNINDNSKNLEKQSKQTKQSTMNWAKYGVAITAAALGIGKATKSSSEALATQIRFNSVFNTTEGQLQQATAWVDNFTNALYLDKQEVRGAITTFKQLTTNMGISNDTANLMSKNLTQIGYDLAAFTNIPVSEVFTALTSGIGGEAEAMKRFGVMLNEATLQQTLYANGINRTVSELSSAQRAELMYYQIMQATTAQQGYAAKTLMQPANALVIVKTQFTNLARAIGNIFLPILMAMIPYVIAITQLLTELAQAIANFFGFKIDFNAPQIETDLGGISSGIGDIGDTAGEADKKIKNMLRDFDELHVVDFGNDTSSGSGGGTGTGAGGSLGLPLQDYDALSGLQDEITEKVEKIKNFIKEIKDYIIAIGLGIAAWKLFNVVGNLIEMLGLIKNFSKTLFALGTATIAIGLYLTFAGTSQQLTEGTNIENFMKATLGNLATGIGATLLAHSMGAGWKMALAIGLTITVFLEAFNFGIALGDLIAQAIGLDEIDINEYMEKWNFTPDEATLTEKLGFAAQVIWDTLKNAIKEKMGIDGESFAKSIGISIVTALISGIVIAIVGIPGAIATLFGVAVGALSLGFGLVLNQLGLNWENIKQWFTNASNNIKQWFKDRFQDVKDFCSWIQDIVVNFFKDRIEDIVEFKNNFVNKFTEIKDSAVSKITEIKDNIIQKFTDIKDGIEEKINNAKEIVKNAIDAIKGFFNFSWQLPDIKLPRFKWTSQPASGWMANVLSALNLPTSLPKLNVEWVSGYATGGFPKKGELFVANENAPEMIGKMGNRNVVANNQQITTGIANAVYDAIVSANLGGNNGDTYVYVGDKQITDVITKRQKSNNDKFGR